MISPSVSAVISKQSGRFFLFHNEGMVTRGFKIIGYVFEHALTTMMNFGNFAVHEFGRAHHLAAKGLAYGLQAKAHAEDGNSG